MLNMVSMWVCGHVSLVPGPWLGSAAVLWGVGLKKLRPISPKLLHVYLTPLSQLFRETFLTGAILGLKGLKGVDARVSVCTQGDLSGRTGKSIPSPHLGAPGRGCSGVSHPMKRRITAQR